MRKFVSSLKEEVCFKPISKLSTTNGLRAQPPCGAESEFQSPDDWSCNVDQTEFWSEESAYHDVRQSDRDVTTDQPVAPASRPVKTRLGLYALTLQ